LYIIHDLHFNDTAEWSSCEKHLKFVRYWHCFGSPIWAAKITHVHVFEFSFYVVTVLSKFHFDKNKLKKLDKSKLLYKNRRIAFDWAFLVFRSYWFYEMQGKNATTVLIQTTEKKKKVTLTGFARWLVRSVGKALSHELTGHWFKSTIGHIFLLPKIKKKRRHVLV